MASAYTEEQKEWLIKYAGTMPYKDLTTTYNKRFDSNKKYDAIRKYCLNRLGVQVGNNAFIEKIDIKKAITIFLNNKYKSYKEIGDIYNKTFGTDFSYETIENRLRHAGYKKESYGHTKGNTHNEKPLLSIRNNSAGFEMIKVKQGTKDKRWMDGWVTLSNYRYEKYYNVKLKDNEFVIFLNNNNRDYRKENLIKITKDEHLQLNRLHCLYKGEITTTMLEVIRTKKELKKIEVE